MRMRLSKRTFWLSAFLILFLAGIIACWLLSAADVICVARTKIEPPASLFSDGGALSDAVETRRALALASLNRSVNQDTGFFVYEAYPNGAVSNDDNDIRQLLASRILAEEASADAALRTLHERNLKVVMENWYKEAGDRGYVYAYGKSKLGANAMLLRVLVASPDFDAYAKEAKQLKNGILSLLHADGSFEPWYVEPDYAYDRDYLLTFYSGEAILALLEYGEKTKDSSAIDAAKRAEEYYMGSYVDRLDEHYYPAYVPWHTLALAHLYRTTHDARYRNAIFVLNDKLLELLDRTEFIGRFYNPATPEYGTPHASSDAVYTEGLAEAYAIAREGGDTVHEARYREALVLAYQNLANLQYAAPWYRVFDDADARVKLAGGIMANACEPQIRIDSTAHAIDAFDGILRAIP